MSQNLGKMIADALLNGTTQTVNLTQLLSDSGVKLPPNFPINLNNVTVSELNRLLGKQLVEQIVEAATPLLQTSLFPKVKVRVVAGIDSPNGKWPTSLGNVVVLEKKYIPSLLQSLLPANPKLLIDLANTIANNSNSSDPNQQNLVNLLLFAAQADLFLSNVTMDDYAFIASIQLSDRWSIYQLDLNPMTQALIDRTNAIYEAIGFNFPADPTVPIVLSLKNIIYIKLFLEQIFLGVMSVTVTLGSMLIYSLLLSNVQEKTYEYGMLRALGFKRRSLILLLVVQAMFFTLPGISLGLFCAWILNIPVTIILSSKTSFPVGFSLAPSSILLSTLVGLIVPIVSNIAPIRNALSRTLRDSLDVYHQTPGTSVRMVKLENLGLSPWQIALSVMMIVAGFLIYYMVPYSFTFDNLQLFLTILTIILLGMVLGMCMVATSFQSSLEKVMLFLLMWGKDRSLLTLVRKSLSGHRGRNRKTALMFTVSLAFIVFAGTSFRLQANSIQDAIKANLGTNIYISAPSWNSPLNETSIRSLLDSELAKGSASLISFYDFATFSLTNHPKVDRVFLSNLAGTPNVRVNLIGVGKIHLLTTWEQFYIPSQVSSQFSYSPLPQTSKPNIIKSLYDDAGKALLPQEKGGIVVPPPIGSSYFNSSTPSLDNRTQSDIYHHYYDVAISEAMVSFFTFS